MKKLFSLLLVLLLIPCAALASVDLTGLSFEELVALKDQINLAIWQSEEWQAVEVPKGVYTVGEDIPAGKWTITASDETKAHIYWGDRLDASGVNLSYEGSIWEAELLYSPTYRSYEKGDPTEVTWELKEGHYFIVQEGIAVFSPYAGKPSLGFK